MATTDDLNAAVSALEAQIQATTTEITAAIAAITSATPTDLQPFIDRINASVQALSTADANLKNAIPTPTPPTPTP